MKVCIYIYTSVYIPFLGEFFPSIRAGKWFGTTECPRLLDGTCNTWKCGGGGFFLHLERNKSIIDIYIYIYIASRLSSTIIIIIVLWLLLVEVEVAVVVEVVVVVVVAAGAGAGGWRGGVVLSSLLSLRNGCMFHISAGFLPSIVWVCLKYSGSIVGHDEVWKQKMVGPPRVGRHSQIYIHP